MHKRIELNVQVKHVNMQENLYYNGMESIIFDLTSLIAILFQLNDWMFMKFSLYFLSLYILVALSSSAFHPVIHCLL